jgi:hypothetical protein
MMIIKSWGSPPGGGKPGMLFRDGKEVSGDSKPESSYVFKAMGS